MGITILGRDHYKTKAKKYENKQNLEMENDNLTAIDPSPIMEEETNHDANGYAIENDQETTTKNEEVCTKVDDDDVDSSASKKTPPEEKSPKKRKTKKVTKRKKVVESSD